MMDIEELRRLIRAAIVAAPLASAGCGAGSAAAGPATSVRRAVETTPASQPEQRPPEQSEPEQSEPEQSEPGSAAEPEPDQAMDPDEFDRQWRRCLGWGQPDPPPPRRRPLGIIEGRPLIGDGVPVRASLRRGDDWAAPIEVPRESPQLRRLVAEHWLRAARAEHASVASFARATLELMQVGAPPELVARYQQAGIEEVEHARLSFGLAVAYAGVTYGPGQLTAPPPRPPDLARLARDTFLEGCLNETAAALLASRAAARCEVDTVRAVLEQIAADEAEHAALAWATVRWALSAGGEPVRRALAEVQEPEPGDLGPPGPTSLPRLGILDAAATATAQRQAWERLVAPLRDELLGRVV